MQDLGVGLVGHTRPCKVVQAALERGRLGQTSLLVGPSGVGRGLFARGVARYLLCHRQSASGYLAGCGKCRSCELFDAGTHPDFRSFRKPQEDQEFKMALMEEVIQWFALRPVLGERKVTVLEDVDYLNEESANCFLKAAEEPPPGMWVAMLSENPERLPPTIRSRCQFLHFNRLSEIETMRVLEARGGVQGQKAKDLARLSGGVPGRALELADPAIWNLWTSLSQQLVPGRFNCCAWADEWKNWVDNSGPTGATQRPAARKILYLMACFVSDVMRQHLGHDQKGGSGKMAEVCSVIAARIQEPLLRRWYDITSEADLRILRRAQIGLVIEAYADELAQILAMV
jgi:DNA polymerase-3 subunit delta'